MGQLLFKKAFPHILAIATILILNIIYFYPQLEGKVIEQGDMVSASGIRQEINTYQEAGGENIFWTNAMFGGMPSYLIGGVKKSSYMGRLVGPSKLFFADPIGVFILGMLCTYIALLTFGVSPWISLIGAIIFGFTSNSFILWEAGHVTKLNAIAYGGLVIGGFNLVILKKRYLLGATLFGLGLGLNLRSFHIQMTYYLFLVMLFYYGFIIVDAIKKKYLPELGKASLALILGGMLAVGSNATNLWINYSYSKDTMRGTPILKSVSNTEATSSSETEGLAWDYAMQWSNGPMDLVAGFIPGVVGGGSREKVSREAATYKDLKGKGANLGADFKAPLYWGALPFTSGPTYFGAVLLFLLLMAVQTLKGPTKWWMISAIIFTSLLSLGKHFALLNEPLFNYLPFYSKFRAPSSILGVTALILALMGTLGLAEIVQSKNKKTLLKPLMIALGSATFFCLFFAFVGPAIFDFSNPGDARLEQSGYSLSAIISDRQSLMRMDSLRTLLFVAASGALVYFYLKGKLNQAILLAGIGLLSIIDLSSVGKRYLSTKEFVTPQKIQENFKLRAVDQQIFNAENINIEQGSPQVGNGLGRGGYRVLDMSINTFNSSSTSYFHNTIGGYHPAKLQRYQDIIDYHITKNNTKVLNMLNTKYFITQQQQVQTNQQALGTAWFVENIIKVNTPNEELETLNTFNPANDAVVLDQEFNNYIGGFDPVKNGTIQQTSYHPNKLTYQSNSTSEQLAVFSEIWYGPDKGWKVTIDGEKAIPVRANYLLRALRVPAGDHTIEFTFDPTPYYVVENISYFSSLALVLFFLGIFGFRGYNWWKNEDFSKEVKLQAKRETIKKTVSKKDKYQKKSGKKGKKR